MLLDSKHGVTILAMIASFHLATHVVCHLLQTIADTKDRHTSIENGRVDTRSVSIVDRVRRARENDTLGLEVEICHLLCAWQHLTVHAELTDTAGNKVRVLRAKVQNEDSVVKLVDLGYVLLGGH